MRLHHRVSNRLIQQNGVMIGLLIVPMPPIKSGIPDFPMAIAFSC
jgi:hypothetical protein